MTQPNKRFTNFITKQDTKGKTFPLVHITNAYNFDKIKEDNALVPLDCSVFQQKLVYFFYGRPSYRTKNQGNHKLAFDWPVILLFDTEKISEKIVRIFPFDTGAFHNKLYTQFFDSNSKLEDFELLPDVDNAKRVVSAFYTSNSEYYYGCSTKNVDISFDDFEASGVHELARMPNAPESSHSISLDERTSSIEFQATTQIDIRENIIGIVLPERYIESKAWVKSIDRWNPNYVEVYSVVNCVQPEFFAGMIFEKVRQIYLRAGIIEK